MRIRFPRALDGEKPWKRAWYALCFPGLFLCCGITLANADFAQHLLPDSTTSAEPGKPQCSDIAVEQQIAMTPSEGLEGESLLNFSISIFVANNCQEPARILQESFIAYRTNLPLLVGDKSQPQECLGQQLGFSGLVPPMQKFPFVVRRQGCLLPASPVERPRVTVETGRVVTDRGEKTIPHVMEELR